MLSGRVAWLIVLRVFRSRGGKAELMTALQRSERQAVSICESGPPPRESSIASRRSGRRPTPRSRQKGHMRCNQGGLGPSERAFGQSEGRDGPRGTTHAALRLQCQVSSAMGDGRWERGDSSDGRFKLDRGPGGGGREQGCVRLPGGAAALSFTSSISRAEPMPVLELVLVLERNKYPRDIPLDTHPCPTCYSCFRTLCSPVEP